jgi:hypothetical protein
MTLTSRRFVPPALAAAFGLFTWAAAALAAPINPTWSAVFAGSITAPGGSPQSTNGSLTGISLQPIIPPGPSAAFDMTADTAGGGTVMSGPFAGISFADTNIWIQIGTVVLAFNGMPIGTADEVYTSLSGTTSGVTIVIGGVPQNTGTISFSLDPTGTSHFDWNFAAGTVSEQLELLATFPLQVSLGAPPVPITIDESGSITSTALVPEPSTWLMLATGLFGLLGFGWRQRKRGGVNCNCSPNPPGMGR